MIKVCFIKALYILAALISPQGIYAQEEASVQWLTFEQLEDSLDVNSKKVFIDFYTDWCTYCRKMDRVVYTKAEVVERLNQDYYAVKFNAESTDTVYFEGQTFYNKEIGQTRKPIHQLAQILALRQGKFVAPTLIILEKDFTVKHRYFEYLDSKKLMNALK